MIERLYHSAAPLLGRAASPSFRSRAPGGGVGGGGGLSMGRVSSHVRTYVRASNQLGSVSRQRAFFFRDTRLHVHRGGNENVE